MRKLFFIIACSMVCLFQTITLQAQPNASIFAQFPWISTNNLVQQDRCTTEKIVVYTAGIYSFLLITDANGTEQLYNQDGLFYCQNASNYDCIAAYNLGTPTTTWNCTGASSQDCLAEEEIIQRLKGEQAGCEIVTSISKIEYDGNTYYTYDIGTNPNIPCPTIPAWNC